MAEFDSNDDDDPVYMSKTQKLPRWILNYLIKKAIDFKFHLYGFWDFDFTDI